MKIPKQIKVAGRIIEVKYPYLFQDGISVNWGAFNPTGQMIYITEVDQHGNQRHIDTVMHSYLHEIIHAVDFLYNNYEVSNHADGERWIDQISEGLLQVIRDNDIDFRS